MVGEHDDRGCCLCTRVLDYAGSLALHDGDARVGRSWVNTDNNAYMNVNIAGKGDDTYVYQRLLSSCFHRGGDAADKGAQEVSPSPLLPQSH